MQRLSENKIVINGACSQYDRWLRALDADYARVDSRPFSELLTFADKFASLIQFYDLKNQRNGDWVDFFRIDPTIILGSVDAADVVEVETAFLRTEQQTTDQFYFDRKFELFAKMFASIYRLARQTDIWYVAIEQISDEQVGGLQHDMRTTIASHLNEQLRSLKSFDLGADLEWTLQRPIGLDFDKFSSAWNLNQVEPDGSVYTVTLDGESTPNRVEMIDRATQFLNPILDSFVCAISEWQRLAQRVLPTTLETGDHKPQVAMYVTFAKLFQTAQATINTFSSRYLNFYYDDVLREPARGPVPDSVYLTFDLADDEEVLQSTVPQGTVFPAGQDANENEILYAAAQNLAVTRAALNQIRTLHVDRGPLFLNSHQDSTDVVRRIISAAPSAIPDPASPENLQPWKTFGSASQSSIDILAVEPQTPDTNETDATVSSHSILGFAIASNYLLLTGGQRTVQLDISFGPSIESELGQIRGATGLTSAEILRRILDEAFEILVSIANGWLEIETYEVTVPPFTEQETGAAHTPRHPKFTLEFSLPPSAPPIVAFNTEGEGDVEVDSSDDLDETIQLGDVTTFTATANPEPNLPTLKAYLKQTRVRLQGPTGSVNIYRLSLLDRLQIFNFKICTSVQSLSNLVLTCTDGEIDTNGPFMPFGGTPVVGSFLQIRSDELFEKTPNQLSITVDWFNLPPNTNGFWGYYRDYVIGLDGKDNNNKPGDLFNNQSFQGNLSVLGPGTWEFTNQVGDNAPVNQLNEFLFRTTENCNDPTPTVAGTLCQDTQFEIPDSKIKDRAKPNYYSPSQSAIQLRLTEPSYAFGNDLYPQNVLNAVIDDLPDIESCNEDCLAECQDLQDAAAGVLECLAKCADAQTPQEYSTCLQDNLRIVEKRLRAASIAAFMKCVKDCVDKPILNDPDFRKSLDDLSDYLHEAIEIPSDDEIRDLRDVKKHFRETLDDDTVACLENCWESALTAWNAAAFIEACIVCVGDNSDNKEHMSDCLLVCQGELQAAYTVCLEKCINECAQPKNELKYPNEPYLPQATNVSIDYSASCTVPAFSWKTKCESECKVLKTAAERIEQSLENCKRLVGRPFEKCMDENIATCIRELLDDFVRCIQHCENQQGGETLDETRANRAIDRLDRWWQLSTVDRVHDIDSCMTDCRTILGWTESNSQSNCYDKCLSILVSIMCVIQRTFDCHEDMYAVFKNNMDANLIRCSEFLDQAYIRCLAECRKRECLEKCNWYLKTDEQIEALLNRCSAQDGRAFFDCIKHSLGDIHNQLIEDGLSCLFSCVRHCGEQSTKELEDYIDVSRESESELGYNERITQLKAFLTALTEHLPESEASKVTRCWRGCLMLFEAAHCLESSQADCQADMFDGYKTCMNTGLVRCQERLEKAYHRCVKECQYHKQDATDKESHHAHCRKKCEILLEAAAWIERCRERCHGKSGESYVECIDKNVLRCHERLLIATQACLRNCLREHEDDLDKSVVNLIESRLINKKTDSQSGHRLEHGRALKQNLDVCWSELEDKDLDSLKKCRVKCLELLDAALCLEDCLVRCRKRMYDKYKSCIVPRLKHCQEQIRNDYRECIDDCDHQYESLERDNWPDTCKAECDVLNEASIWVNACRIKCLDNTGPGYVECISDGVLECQEALLRASIECYTNCLEHCAEQLPADIIECIESCLAHESDDSFAQRASRLKKCLRKCIAEVEHKEWKCLTECTGKCWVLLETILMLETSLNSSQDKMYATFKTCITAGLNECKVELNAAYIKCVETCMAGEPDQEPCADIFHLLPFGGYKSITPRPGKSFPLLPQFEYDGNLYLGFDELVPPQELTLLFQMACGNSVNESSNPPVVSWHYLTSRQWQRLENPNILADSTNGLQNTGVVSLRLPNYDPVNNTTLPVPQDPDDDPVDYQWLRASVKTRPCQFPETNAIYPHATLATWLNVNQSGEHLRKPLPPYTIDSSLEELPDIANVFQPIESFGGRPAETNRTFQTRLGERLRHKDRANLGWDYERMVLEQFPQIWKTQTLPARNSQQGNQPGCVLIVVVPGPDSLQVIDPTAPRAPRDLLEQIQAYLSEKASTFADLTVVNPNYVRIEVKTTVTFRSEEDRGDTIDRLNDDLIDYLSPWFYDAARARKKGHYHSKADVSEFIQSRWYVESIKSVELIYERNESTEQWCFYTSAKKHGITVL